MRAGILYRYLSSSAFPQSAAHCETERADGVLNLYMSHLPQFDHAGQHVMASDLEAHRTSPMLEAG